MPGESNNTVHTANISSHIKMMQIQFTVCTHIFLLPYYLTNPSA